jgi:hypothetical protein
MIHWRTTNGIASVETQNNAHRLEMNGWNRDRKWTRMKGKKTHAKPPPASLREALQAGDAGVAQGAKGRGDVKGDLVISD